MQAIVKASFVVLAAVIVVASAAPASAQDQPQTPTQPTTTPITTTTPATTEHPLVSSAIDEHCPVCIIETEKWIKGDRANQITRDRRVYFFENEEHKNLFLRHLEKYVPAMHGDCVVTFSTTGKRVPGTRDHMLMHKGRLFLFANKEAKEHFQADPTLYENVDLAFGGHCPVTIVEEGQHEPGRPEIIVHFEGIRYFFPSEKHRDTFMANPEKYKMKAPAHEEKEMKHEEEKTQEKPEGAPHEPGMPHEEDIEHYETYD